jgi:thermostable 8-oxoguanine DNA glycosylase
MEHFKQINNIHSEIKYCTDVTHMVTQYKKVNIQDHCNMGVQLVSERCPREDLKQCNYTLIVNRAKYILFYR